VKDPRGQWGWPQEKGRDGERTPMQWNSAKNAGFSSVAPWLPLPPSYITHNVAVEEKDPNSILNWYKQLLKLRHTEPALLEGLWIPLNESDQNVLAYLRRYKDQALLVALNMSGREQKVRLELPAPGRAAINTVMSTSSPARMAGDELTLEPFGVYIGRLQAGPSRSDRAHQ
jgi:alpha-glucosidase